MYLDITFKKCYNFDNSFFNGKAHIHGIAVEKNNNPIVGSSSNSFFAFLLTDFKEKRLYYSPMYGMSKKKKKHLYLLQYKVSYRNETGPNHHGLLSTSV